MSNFNKFFKPTGFILFRENSRSLLRGFTLIELLIAIVIITILSSVGIASFNGISRSNAMQQQAQEIKSLARKLRSDATAGVKVVTGATTATSCKSVDADPDAGILYGAYINFQNNANTINYGISCWENSTIDHSPAASVKTLPQGMVIWRINGVTIPTDVNTTIFFSFEGKVYVFDCANAALECTDANNNNLNIAPDQASIIANVTPIATTQYIYISDDGTNNPRNYRINFGPTGLVCEEKASISAFCAEP